MRWYWPWNRQQTPSHAPENTIAPSQESPPDEEELANSLSVRLSQLESDLAGLRLEWAEVLDKLNRWASRQSARERRRAVAQLDELGDGPEIAQEAAGATNGHLPDSGSPDERSRLKAALRAKIRR
jgi:hypothetical protein